MSSDLASIENIWQLLKMNLRRKKIESYQSLVSAMKGEWEFLSLKLTIKSAHIRNNRISEVMVTLHCINY